MTTAQEQSLTITIITQNGAYAGTFDKNAKVSEVIEEVIGHFGLDQGDKFDLVYDGNVLSPDRPLVSYHIADDAELQLAPYGSGVYYDEGS